MSKTYQGIILKAISGFYYVYVEGALYACRARGKHRHAGVTPLVGDRVSFTPLDGGSGALDEILPRRNEFYRPAVANVDQLVIIASNALPVTDPYLIDRMTAVAAYRGCGCVICVNKCDLDRGDMLYETYRAAGYSTVRVSAATGEGIEALRGLLRGRVSAFTGNSGVGKSSILNALYPNILLPTGEVSEKLGRGRHTTRHVELFAVDKDTLAADTPGFASFDALLPEALEPGTLADCFPDFRPMLGTCRFPDCAHAKEQGCAILAAVERGEIARSRHESYLRLCDETRRTR